MYVLSTRTIEGLIRDCDSIEAPSYFFLCFGAYEKSTATLRHTWYTQLSEQFQAYPMRVRADGITFAGTVPQCT